jgi:hypothetical protein
MGFLGMVVSFSIQGALAPFGNPFSDPTGSDAGKPRSSVVACPVFRYLNLVLSNRP